MEVVEKFESMGYDFKIGTDKVKVEKSNKVSYEMHVAERNAAAKKAALRSTLVDLIKMIDLNES